MKRRRYFRAACVLTLLVAVSLPQASAATEVGSAPPVPVEPTNFLSLEEAVELALGSDETIAQAELAVDKARTDVIGAGSGRLPQLDLAGVWTRNLKNAVMFLPSDMATAFGGVTQIEMGDDKELAGAVSLTWNLWTAGRLSAAVGAAREALEATRWQEALVRDAITYSAEAAYYDAQLATEQVRIAERSLEATQEAHRVTAAGFEQGTTSRFDLLRAQVEMANRETPLIQARNALEISLSTLRRVCGLVPDRNITLAEGFATVPEPAELTSLLIRMHSGSHELRALDHAVAARREALAASKAARGPILQLQGSYALQGSWDDGLYPDDDERATSATVALGFSMPIFDGFSTKAAIGAAKVDLRTTELEAERIRRERDLSVRQARMVLLNAQAALEGRHESVELAEEAHRLALVRLENGLATPLERLDAELALTEASVQLASTLHDCNLARASLELAVGDAPVPNVGTEEEN